MFTGKLLKFSHTIGSDFNAFRISEAITKEGIIDRKRIIIKYAKQKGEFTERMIEPLKLIFRFRDWYLHAYCLKRIYIQKKHSQG